MFMTGPIEAGSYTLNITFKQNIVQSVRAPICHQFRTVKNLAFFQNDYEIGLIPNQIFWAVQFGQTPAGEKMYQVLSVVFERSVDELLCILDISYTKETVEELLDPHSRSQRSGTFDPSQNTQLYDAQVEYECGFAQEFEIEPGVTSPNLTLTCLGTGSWDKPVSDCICKELTLRKHWIVSL